MLDWLQEILGDAYSNDMERKISDEIGKGFVSRADFNAVNERKKRLEEQLRESDETSCVSMSKTPPKFCSTLSN